MHIFHQFFERQILVRIGFQSNIARSVQEFSKSGIARKIAAQHQGIGKETYQSLEFGPCPACDGRAYGNILLPAVATKEDLKRRQERHVQCSILAATQVQKPVC